MSNVFRNDVQTMSPRFYLSYSIVFVSIARIVRSRTGTLTMSCVCAPRTALFGLLSIDLSRVSESVLAATWHQAYCRSRDARRRAPRVLHKHVLGFMTGAFRGVVFYHYSRRLERHHPKLIQYALPRTVALRVSEWKYPVALPSF